MELSLGASKLTLTKDGKVSPDLRFTNQSSAAWALCTDLVQQARWNQGRPEVSPAPDDPGGLKPKKGGGWGGAMELSLGASELTVTKDGKVSPDLRFTSLSFTSHSQSLAVVALCTEAQT